MRYVLSFVALAVSCSMLSISDNDKMDRDRVVRLSGNGGYCTGAMIIAPSDKPYIITAAHCNVLRSKEDNTINAETEDGMIYQVHIVKMDVDNDLMILDPIPGRSLGFVIAPRIEKHQKVHTMSRGKGFPSYRTDGEFLDIIVLPMGFDFLSLAPINVTFAATTAWVIPGSSGGPMLSEHGELIGVIQAMDMEFLHISYISPLKVLQDFVKDL